MAPLAAATIAALQAWRGVTLYSWELEPPGRRACLHLQLCGPQAIGLRPMGLLWQWHLPAFELVLSVVQLRTDCIMAIGPAGNGPACRLPWDTCRYMGIKITGKKSVYHPHCYCKSYAGHSPIFLQRARTEVYYWRCSMHVAAMSLQVNCMDQNGPTILDSTTKNAFMCRVEEVKRSSNRRTGVS